MNDIERQIEFEQTRQLTARTRFKKDLRKMRYEMSNGYLSGTAAGRQLANDLLAELLPKLEAAIARRGRVNTESNFWIKKVCEQLGNETVLGICLKSFIDTCGQESNLTATKVLSNAASRLNTELVRQVYHQENPELMNSIEVKYRSKGVYHKLAGAKTTMGKVTGLSVQNIKTQFSLNYYKAAEWVLTTINEHTDWFTIQTKYVSRNRKQNIVQLSPRFEEWYRQFNHAVELQLMEAYPMLCPPRSWSDEGLNGGYLTPVRRYAHLMKDRKGVGSEPGPKLLALINDALHPTAWELNPFVQEVQQHCYEHDIDVDSFRTKFDPPILGQTMPAHLAELPNEHPDRNAWVKEKAIAHDAANEARKACLRTTRNVTSSVLYAQEERFWIPYASGHNGRVYVLSQGCLSPQGSDAERSLLRFHEAAPVTASAKHHLALHVANQYGITDSHDDKLQWVKDNTELITQIATDPTGSIPHWERADEPWQFLAACDEYYRCVITEESTTTKLPVCLDATASGLQILSLLSRDRECAEHVNLIPGLGHKSDVYANLKPYLRAVLREMGHNELAEMELPRKTYKVNLVSRIYGSKLRSRRKSILKTMRKAGLRISYEQAKVLSEAFEEAMKRLAPGALELFDDLAALGKHCSAHEQSCSWVTPTGNKVVIKPTKSKSKQVKLGWWGELCLADPEGEEHLDKRKVASSTAPLLVHSLDSCLLQEAFHDWTKPLGTIHDCFAVRASDIDDALQSILEAMVTVLKEIQPWLQQVAIDNGADIQFRFRNTMTDTDVDNIINCEYAFC